MQEQNKLIIGSFPFRGAMQPVRLICEYIDVKYQNKLFNPIQWDHYKQTEARDWLYVEIPFIKCGEFVITNTLAAAQYVVQKYNRLDLLGITEKQKITINSSVIFHNIIKGALSLECDIKSFSPQQKKIKRQVYFNEEFAPKFKKVNDSVNGPWLFNHLTILDFFIYEDYKLFSIIYPEVKNFTNLKMIYQNVAKLPQIKKYEESATAIKQICPNKYFANFAQKCEKYFKSKSQNTNSYFKMTCESNKSIKGAKEGFCLYKKNQNGMDFE